VLSRAEPAPLRLDKSGGPRREGRESALCAAASWKEPGSSTVRHSGADRTRLLRSRLVRQTASSRCHTAWRGSRNEYGGPSPRGRADGFRAGFLSQPFPSPSRYLPEGRRLVGVGAGSDWIEYSTIPNPKAAPARTVQSPPDSPESILVRTAPPAAPPRRVSPLRKAGSCSIARPTPAAALLYPES
jgi:hypothetical protein